MAFPFILKVGTTFTKADILLKLLLWVNAKFKLCFTQ